MKANIPKLIKQTLGRTGPSLSQLVYGAWRLYEHPESANPQAVAERIRHCVELGISSFDHADIYGGYRCEELFGAALAQSGIARTQIELVSKCGIMLVAPTRPEHKCKHYDTSAQHIVRSVERSLKNLRTDYLDILLIHRPDPLLAPAEVAEALLSLRRDGKVRGVGVSNFLPAQIRALEAHAGPILVTNQLQFSALHLEPLDDGSLDYCLEHGTSPMIWSPLAGGQIITSQEERALRVRAVLARIGEECGGYGVEQVALAWVMRHPSRPLPVIGTGSVERLNLAVAATALQLSREQWHEIWSASRGQPIP